MSTQLVLPRRNLVRPVTFSGLDRYEWIGDIAHTINTPATLGTRQGSLPTDRFISSLLLEVEGRLAITVADATSERADSPQSLVDRVEVGGYHRIRNRDELFFAVRGRECWELGNIYQSRAPGSTGAMGVAVANKDFRFYLPILFAPLNMPERTMSQYVLDAPRYTNPALTIFWGDGKSAFDPAGGTVFTFSAFNSAAGAPRARIYAKFAPVKGGAAGARGLVTGRVWRYFKEITGTTMTTTATDARIADLPVGHLLRSILIKTGTKGTTLTAGNNAFQAFSPSGIAATAEVISNLRVMHGTNNPIRTLKSFLAAREISGQEMINIPSAGHALIDFAFSGRPETVFNARSLIKGATGDVDFFLQADVTGAANQAALLLFEEWRGSAVVL